MKRSERLAYKGPTIKDIFWQLHTVNGLCLEALGALQEPSDESDIDVIRGELDACLSALVEAGTRLMNVRAEANAGAIPF